MKYNHSFVPSLLRKRCRALLYHFCLEYVFSVVARRREMSVPEVCRVRGAGCYTVSTYIQHAYQGIKVV